MAGFILQFETLFLLNTIKVNHFFCNFGLYIYILRKIPKSWKGLDIYKLYFPARKSLFCAYLQDLFCGIGVLFEGIHI